MIVFTTRSPPRLSGHLGRRSRSAAGSGECISTIMISYFATPNPCSKQRGILGSKYLVPQCQVWTRHMPSHQNEPLHISFRRDINTIGHQTSSQGCMNHHPHNLSMLFCHPGAPFCCRAVADQEGEALNEQDYRPGEQEKLWSPADGLAGWAALLAAFLLPSNPLCCRWCGPM